MKKRLDLCETMVYYDKACHMRRRERLLKYQGIFAEYVLLENRATGIAFFKK